MLKNIIKRGIRLKKCMLWIIAVLLCTMTLAVAAVADGSGHTAVVNRYGIGAPFLISWLPVWVFAAAGGYGSTFIIIADIDKHFNSIKLAKFVLGLSGAMALCLVFATGQEPPRPILSGYAFISAILAAPLLLGLIMIASLPKNQAGLFNAVNPFKFKIVVDEGARHDDKP